MLDANIKNNLINHLFYVHNGGAQGLELGTTDQLKSAVKIYESPKIQACFHISEPRSLPILPRGQYLVGCVDRYINIKVYAIYTFEQMKSIINSVNRGMARKVDFMVMEINPDLEAELLLEVLKKEEAMGYELKVMTLEEWKNSSNSSNR